MKLDLKIGAAQAQIERATELAIEPANRSAAAANQQEISKDDQVPQVMFTSSLADTKCLVPPSKRTSAPTGLGASQEHGKEKGRIRHDLTLGA